MCIGIATDHGGSGLKEALVAQLRAGGHAVEDFVVRTRSTTIQISSFHFRRLSLMEMWNAGLRSAVVG